MSGDSERWANRELDPVDALLLRGDESPKSRSTMHALYILEDAPSWQRVVAAFDRASRSVPKLRQKVVPSGLPFNLPHWVLDPDFDLGHHMHRMSLQTTAATLRDLLELAQVQSMAPLHPARPLWEATLIEGLDPETCSGRAALLIKASHAVGDGLAGMAMALALFDFERDPNRDPMPPAPVAEEVRPVDLGRERLRRLPAAMIDRSAKNARRNTAMMASAARHPSGTASSALAGAGTVLRWTRSLARGVAPGTRRSPAWHGRGQRRRYSVLEVPLDELRSAGKAVGGSVNDAYLAAVLGGIRRYHDQSGYPLDEITVAVPVSLRAANGHQRGNRFAGARFAGPAGETDPARRVQQVHDLVKAGRAEPALDAFRAVAPVLARLPNAAVGGLRALLMTHDVQVSNIPGYPSPVYLAGQSVLRMYAFGPVPGVAAMIVLVSHVGTCYVGVNVDPDAVRDPELFDACLQAGFAEVLALAQAATTPNEKG